MLESEERQIGHPAAARIGQALIDAHEALTATITFEGGCLALAPMFATVAKVDTLLLTIETVAPAVTLCAVIRPGQEPVLLDSREGEIDVPGIEDFAPEAIWQYDLPDRLHVCLRLRKGVIADAAGLDVLAALILPYFELARRSDRLARATSLLDVALEAVSAQEADSVPRNIMRRIGYAVNAVAGFFPAEQGALPPLIQPQAVASAAHDEALVTQIFRQFGQMPGGPVQRVFDAPLRAAPLTRFSLAGNDDGVRVAALLQQMPVSDYIVQRVMHQNRVIGVMVVLATTLPGDPVNRFFTANEIAEIRSLAVIAGWALPLAAEYARLRRNYQQSEMLRQVAITSFRLRDFDQTVSVASTIAKTVLGADYVAVSLIAEDWSSSRWAFVQGNRTEQHLHRELHQATKAQRDWYRRPSWYVIQDISKELNVAAGGHLVHHAEGLISSISVSFLTPDGGYGFLLLGFRHRQPIHNSDVEFAQSMAQTIAAVL